MHQKHLILESGEKLAPMGEGRTVALKGVVVSDIYYAKCNIKYYLDMGGECAKYSNFSRHYHIILDATPAEGVSDASYAEALKYASLSINVYLAKLAIAMKPDESEVYELGPVGLGADGKPLPKVAYLVTHMASHDTWNFLVYGQSALGFLPTISSTNQKCSMELWYGDIGSRTIIFKMKSISKN